MAEVYLYLFNIHTFIHTISFLYCGEVSVGRCVFLFWGIACSLLFVFGRLEGFGATFAG